MRYNLELFLALNEEYRLKPLVPAPPKYDPDSLVERANRRAEIINSRVRVEGKRMLEIGCGHGEVCTALNRIYGCEVVGVDVSRYPHWNDAPPGVILLQTDLSVDNPAEIGQFGIIYSNSVWEHIRRPFTMLRRAYDLLVPGGHLLLSANLYRGPKASHRYREIFFPWPHLLFCDEVIDEFYRHHLKRPPEGEPWLSEESVEPSYRETELWGCVWVNQLSIADYFNYFNLIGFEVLHTKYSMTPIDEAFVARFADKLDRFPRYDLERDFLHVKLRKPAEVVHEVEAEKGAEAEIEAKVKTKAEANIESVPKRARWSFSRLL